MKAPLLNASSVPLAIFSITLALVSVGVIGVYSASAARAGYEQRMRAMEQTPLDQNPNYHDNYYLARQVRSAVLGLVALAFFYFFDYRHLKRLAFPILFASFVACALVWAPVIGIASKGANRWIWLGPIGTFQPSEFAKLGLIIYMAKMLDDRHHVIGSFFSGVLPAMFVTAAFALVIVLEPDFGGALMLCAIIFGMWLCGEMRWFHLGGLAFAAVPAGVMAFILEPYRVRRLFAFFSDDPEIMLREGYQLRQSLLAFGSGGHFGLGLGQSRQKQFLSEGYSDFIFAIMGEELGFWRMAVIILLFAALVLLGWCVAVNTCDLFGSLLATGITIMVFLGSSVNMCVVLGLLPTKGLVLPMISYGGTSLIIILASIGILMNIAKRQFDLVRPSRPGYASR